MTRTIKSGCFTFSAVMGTAPSRAGARGTAGTAAGRPGGAAPVVLPQRHRPGPARHRECEGCRGGGRGDRSRCSASVRRLALVAVALPDRGGRRNGVPGSLGRRWCGPMRCHVPRSAQAGNSIAGRRVRDGGTTGGERRAQGIGDVGRRPCRIVPAEQGIVPRSGTKMLRFSGRIPKGETAR